MNSRGDSKRKLISRKKQPREDRKDSGLSSQDSDDPRAEDGTSILLVYPCWDTACS